MSFQKLPSNAKKLLDELLNAKNPSQALCEHWEKATGEDFIELQGIVRVLCQSGYLNVNYAGNKPYIVTLNNSARTYNEQLAEYETEVAAHRPTTIYHDHSVRIGNGNKINSSIIGSNIEVSNPPEKKSFWNNHPLLVGIVGGVIAGVLLMFGFWEEIVELIEGLF